MDTGHAHAGTMDGNCEQNRNSNRKYFEICTVPLKKGGRGKMIMRSDVETNRIMRDRFGFEIEKKIKGIEGQ